MPRRNIPIESLIPTEGLHYEVPSSIITPRSSPNLRANSYYGAVQKEYGTSLYCTGTVPATVEAIFEANFVAGAAVEVFTHTGMYKHSSAGGIFVADGQTYSGTGNWSCCMHNDAMFYTNAVELVQYKPAIASTGTNCGSVVASSFKAAALLSVKEHLCLYNVTEAGNACPKRCRWTKAGSLTYTASDFTTGMANFLDVLDVEGKILNALPMAGGLVAVYGEGSVHIQEWVGGTSVFVFNKMVENIEIPSARSVVSNDSVHYVLTRDNVYEYKGGRAFTPIGDAIKKNYLTIVNKDAIGTAFLEYLRAEDELHVWIPTTGTVPDTCLICKIRDNYSWFKVDRAATAAGKSKWSSVIAFKDLVGNMGAQTWKAGDLKGTGKSPVYLLGHADGFVSKRDITYHSVVVGGTASPQTFVFDSKAFSSINDIDPEVRDKYHLTHFKDNNSRWMKTTIEAKGYGSLYTHYSVDDGVTFLPFPESPKTVSATWNMYEFDVDVEAPTFMVRCSNTSTNETIAIDYTKVEFIPGAEAV